MGPVNGAVQIPCYFIQPGDDDDLLRAVDHGGATVAVPVDVYQFPIRCHGVGTHQECVAQQAFPHNLHPFFRGLRRIPVDAFEIFPYIIQQADFRYGNRSAPTDYIVLRN